MRALLRRLKLDRVATWIALILGCAVLVAWQSTPEPSRYANLSADDFKSLRMALDSVRSRAYFSDRIDWSSARDNAFAKANEMGSIDIALREVLKQLGDSHSLYLNPDEARKWDTHPSPSDSVISTWSDGGITYLSIPTFAGTSDLSVEDFSRRIRAPLAASADPVHGAACGWIIDLRQNRGGNMKPMLQGVEPLIGNGIYFHWQTKPGVLARWFAGPARLPAWQVNESPPLLLDPRRPVAVLQGARTTSAGELLLIALRGRPNTRTFGAPTAGKASGNEAIWLPNGGVLAVTTSLAVERGGKLWEGPIPSDEAISNSADAGNEDPTLVRARHWLHGSGCAAITR